MSLISHCKILSQSKHSCMSFFLSSLNYCILLFEAWIPELEAVLLCSTVMLWLCLYSPITWTFRLLGRLKLTGVHVVCVLALSHHHLEPTNLLSGQSSRERGALRRKEEKELACKLCLRTGRARY